MCQQLDGIPLALELAAPRLSALTVHQLVVRLDERFALRAAGTRTALSRQKTIAATLDWSHAVLNNREQHLLRRLSVFAGSWSLEAAEHVCAGEPLDDVLENLEGLICRSMVQVDGRSTEARYSLLQIVRHYATAKLVTTGELARFRDQHRDWYLAFVERAAPELVKHEQLAWLDVMEQDHDNLRAAVAWSLQTSPDYAVRLVAALWLFCQRRSHYAEWAAWLGQLRPSSDQPVPRSKAWTSVLLGSAKFAFEHGDHGRARIQTEACIRMAREVNAPDVRMRGSAATGRLLIDTGETTQAEQVLDEAMEMARVHSDDYVTSLARATKGTAALYRSDFALAQQLLEQGVAGLATVGDRFYLVSFQAYLGRVYRERGDYERAEALLTSSLELARELGSMWEAGVILFYLGSVALYRGNVGEARARAEEALSYGHQCGSDYVRAGSLVVLGLVAPPRATTLKLCTCSKMRSRLDARAHTDAALRKRSAGWVWRLLPAEMSNMRRRDSARAWRLQSRLATVYSWSGLSKDLLRSNRLSGMQLAQQDGWVPLPPSA